MKVLVKETDMISAKSLLELLGSSVERMKNQVTENEELTNENKIAVAGAIEAITDLHNLILNQLIDARNAEKFEDDSDHGGKFDA